MTRLVRDDGTALEVNTRLWGDALWLARRFPPSSGSLDPVEGPSHPTAPPFRTEEQSPGAPELMDEMIRPVVRSRLVVQALEPGDDDR